MIAVLWSSRLFLAAACACALAQTPPDPDARIKLALSARPVGREELLQFRSPALSGAPESPGRVVRLPDLSQDPVSRPAQD